MKTGFEFNTLAEFLDHFKDEETCRKHFAAIRFRHGEYCPHCGHTTIYTFAGGKRYRCAKCKQDFTIKTGTVFGESKLPLRKWFIAIYLLSTTSKGISSVQLAKHVGVTQKTGWFMDHRIRKAMKQNKGQLFGTVEVDEAYIGGREKNKHASKRMLGASGRSTLTKTPIVGMALRGGEFRASATDSVRLEEIEKIVFEHIAPNSRIHTDEMVSYKNLGKFYEHGVVRHSARQYKVGDVHTNTIESFWALFKRGYHGIYHQMSRKHLQRYIDEFVFRLNQRPLPMADVFGNVVAYVTESTKLPYKELTA